MEFISMRIKVKKIDGPRMFDDPIRTELEIFLNPPKENLRSEATTSATPLIFAAASISTDIQVTGSEQNAIKLLSTQHALRNGNRLIYAGEKTEVSQAHAQGLNVSLEEEDRATMAPYYNFSSKVGSLIDFVITYDNEIFFTSGKERQEKQLMQTYGTLLKAVGCMQLDKKVTVEGVEVTYEKLEERIKYISVHNASFTAHPDNIAVSLFVLKQLGLDLGETKVVIPNKSSKWIDKTNPDCQINVRGEIKEASFFLDERRFPAAKAIAEKIDLTILDKMTALFYAIDDEILSQGSEKIVKEVELEKSLLKLTIIKLICCDLFQNKQEKTNLGEVLRQRKLQGENTASNQYFTINKIINSFKESHIDVSFLTQEIIFLLAYKLQKGNLTVFEKKGLDTWLESTDTIPGRCFDLEDENFPALIRFYDENPVKTCVVLLKDYVKGEGLLGMIRRIFSGAWNRNYKDPVNKVLAMDKNKEFPDNVNMGHIFTRLRESGLIFSFDAPNKSRLRKILLFCAHLNGEREGLEQLIESSFVFFPPYPKSRFSFFQMRRQDQVYSRGTQVTDEVGNASHGEAMVDASVWRTADELQLDVNVTQQTSANTTHDGSFELNEESVQYRQSTSPGEASFVSGVSDSGSLNDQDQISDKTTVDSDAESKPFIKHLELPQHSRPSSFISSKSSHSRSPSLCFVSAAGSRVDSISANERELDGSDEEPLRSQSFPASL
jgi:hypothetical protein